MAEKGWSIRSLLNPVAIRLMIYGMNPMDLEGVMQEIEDKVLINAKSLENKWVALWEGKAHEYAARGDRSREKGHIITARESYLGAAQCYFAIYLINMGDMKRKGEYYGKLVDFYHRGASLYPEPVRKVDVPLSDGRELPAYLHTPEARDRIGVSLVFYSGLGSCKEEMNTIARTLTDRGITVLIPDMPGCGESLFSRGITAGIGPVNDSLESCLSFLENQELTSGTRVGCAGLCMGGGYAYKGAARNRGYAFCATLFPLFIAQVKREMTPQWMRSGGWYDFQTGGAEVESFIQEMGRLPGEIPACPFFIVHGRHDNWMGIDDAMELYELVRTEDKEALILEEEPLYSRDEAVMHAMPVGEQMHWVRHVFSDWIADRVKND